MSFSAKAVAALGAVTGCVFFYMAGLFQGGLALTSFGSFDMPRPFAYAPEVARDYLAALDQNDRARALYLGQARLLDTVFPPLFGLFLSGVIWLNTRGGLRLGLVLLPFVYVALDLMENAAVTQLITAQGRLPDAAFVHVRGLTWGKFAALVVAALVAGAALLVARRRGKA